LRNWQVSVGNSPVVLGFDFGGTKIATAVCDLMGNRLASATISTGAAVAGPARGGEPAAVQPAAEHGARAIFDRGIRAARELLATAAPRSELAAVGAATFGIPFEDRVELAPAIDGWESLALGRELRAAFEGAEIRLATDAKAAATAEARWGALNGCDPGVYLNLGTGLAAAIVVSGKVVSGGNGAAGEIGYNLRALSDVGLALEARLPLEDMISGRAVARQAARLSAPGSRVRTAEEVFGASSDEPRLDRLVSEFVTELAFHVVNLAIGVNPVRIAVGGGMVGSWDRLRPGLARALDAGTPFPPELVPARFPADAPLLGAVALAADAAGTPVLHHPGTLTERLEA
jgi:glucokinase